MSPARNGKFTFSRRSLQGTSLTDLKSALQLGVLNAVLTIKNQPGPEDKPKPFGVKKIHHYNSQ